MPARRRNDLVASRRRPEDQGEDEGGPDVAELDDDSLSEASGLTDLDDDDADAEGSDISEQDQDDPDSHPPHPAKQPANGHVTALNGDAPARDEKNPARSGGTDTDAMMNGMSIPKHSTGADEVQFEDMTEDATNAHVAATPSRDPATATSDLPHERRRREQEEYRKKRDADPTFVPNRGGFFMHDHRHAGPASNGFRPFGRGRGRGRGAVGGPFSPANQAAQSVEPADAPWSHDLHESVVEPDTQVQSPAIANGTQSINQSKNLPFAPKSAPPNRSFSRSTHIGNVQIRVLLAGMLDPITFSAVPVKQHTRLPHHRPPLRRDKPVRVSLPDAPPRYIFPAVERSFIFIPRALRPNQQGYGRSANRGGFGPYRGFSSRRTSAYGGSTYSPSVAMSRRSSLAQEVSRDSIVSPSGSTISRPPGGLAEPSKPIVRLPPSIHPQQQPPPPPPPPPHGPASMRHGPAPVVTLPPHPGYPPPQDPTFRENRAAPIPMYQPRPQKAVSVADIESPESVPYPPPQPQQQQPFHHQMPGAVNGQAYSQEPSYNTHSRNASYPSQHSSGTPLSQIPERAIHAQPFQPHPYQQAYYTQPYQAVLAPAPSYYYPPAGPQAPQYGSAMSSSAVAAPAFVPNPQQPSYVLPVASATAPQPTGQGHTVAQEQNGMVYYYDSSQVSAGNGYPAGGQTTGQPGVVVGMGGMMTPSPDGYYYPQPAPGPVYYGQ